MCKEFWDGLYSKMDPREVGYYIYDLFNDDSSQNNTASKKMINE
jgi:hypothetical protein